MTKSNMDTIYNWIVGVKTSDSSIHISDIVETSLLFFDFKKTYEEELNEELSKIDSAYSVEINKKGGCGSCKSKAIKARDAQKATKTKEYQFILTEFPHYIQLAIDAFKTLDNERIKKQNLTLAKVYKFTKDNYREPTKKSWEAIWEVYETNQPE